MTGREERRKRGTPATLPVALTQWKQDSLEHSISPRGPAMLKVQDRYGLAVSSIFLNYLAATDTRHCASICVSFVLKQQKCFFITQGWFSGYFFIRNVTQQEKANTDPTSARLQQNSVYPGVICAWIVHNHLLDEKTITTHENRKLQNNCDVWCPASLLQPLKYGNSAMEWVHLVIFLLPALLRIGLRI